MKLLKIVGLLALVLWMAWITWQLNLVRADASTACALAVNSAKSVPAGIGCFAVVRSQP
jgi:hypothetical protein